MTLDELKGLLGVPLDDTSRDAYLTLMLESGIKAAQEYCDKIDFLSLVNPETGVLVLPAPVKLGIYEWVKAGDNASERGGVVSESIGGMSQSFASAADGSLYSVAHRHWAPYHSDIKFITMGWRR